MGATDPGQTLIALLNGAGGFAAFWIVVVAAALLEAAFPGDPQADVKGRLTVNFGLGLLSAGIGALPLVSAVALALLAEARGWGLLNAITLPGAVSVGLSFLVFDLVGYGFHRLAHAWPPLWRLHRVHHSDHLPDLSTLFRNHPLTALVLIPVHGAAVVALGLNPLGLLLHGLARLVTMALGHANLAARPRLSRFLSLIFVTPAFHRRHHSAQQAETDSNYGEVLTVWDRICGSRCAKTEPVERFGLGDAFDSDAASLVGQLQLPFDRR